MKTEQLSRVFAFDGTAVRTAGTAENPLFVAADVCRALGLTNTSDALLSVPEDEKGIGNSYTLGGNQEVLMLTEPGLYRLIFRSTRPEAERFRKWVFSEVLPAIRRTGRFGVGSLEEKLWEAYPLARTGQVQAMILAALGVPDIKTKRKEEAYAIYQERLLQQTIEEQNQWRRS